MNNQTVETERKREAEMFAMFLILTELPPDAAVAAIMLAREEGLGDAV